jgi:hypothetical protein
MTILYQEAKVCHVWLNITESAGSFYVDCFLERLTAYHQQLYYNPANVSRVFLYETRFEQGGGDEVYF